MKVLVVCHRFPYPPKRGGKIRPFNIIKHLSATCQVTVASLVRSEEEREEGKALARYCHTFEAARVHSARQFARMVVRLPTGIPSSLGYFYSSALARRVRAQLETQRFDLIFVHCSSVAQYVAHVRGIPKILDFGDMDSQKWLDYAKHKAFPIDFGYWLEGTKLALEERKLAKSFDLCTTTTRGELATLNGYGLNIRTDWFPNGVDAEYFAPSASEFDPDTICFIGRMDYYPNQECMFDFCKNTLPLIRQQVPRAKLVIVGADPPQSVRRLGSIPDVTVTGSVDDVRPFLLRSALMVAPLNIARGTQNKILEAMASGVPVVTSNVAACGVDAVENEHFLVAGDPQGYARAVCQILRSPGERRRLSIAGRQRMLSHHSWSGSMRRLDAIVEQCLSAARQPVKSGMQENIA